MKSNFLMGTLIALVPLMGANAQVGMRQTTFNPTIHGFRFSNTFQTEVINDLRFGGLCGGMSYAALDYFKARKAIPAQGFRPAVRTPLFNYIYDRQQKSTLDNIDKWMELMVNPFGWRSDEFFDWGLKATGGGRRQELKAEIDKGSPVVLGLLKPGNGGAGPHHQVLAIGYNGGRYRGDMGAYKEDLEIKIYDPNFPNRIMTLKPSLSKKIYYYKEEPGRIGCQWQTYFVDRKYAFRTPPVITLSNDPNDGKIYGILLEMKTGGDDLRGGNDNLNITLNFHTAPSQTFTNVNKGGRWIGNYVESVPIRLNTPVPQHELKNIVFSTTFGGGIGGDNWNLDEVRAFVRGVPVVSQRGVPLFRFTGSDKKFTLPVPPKAGNDGRIRELSLEIRTGGDDLRGGNDNLNITINYSNGSKQVISNVNKGITWNGNTTQVLTIPLNRFVPKNQIRNIELTTTFGGGIGGDNWNMDWLKVQAKGGGVDLEIYSRTGQPLKRFTGEAKSFTATF